MYKDDFLGALSQLPWRLSSTGDLSPLIEQVGLPSSGFPERLLLLGLEQPLPDSFWESLFKDDAIQNCGEIKHLFKIWEIMSLKNLLFPPNKDGAIDFYLS